MSQTYHIMHKLVNWESQTVHQIPSIQYQHPGGDGAGSGKQVVWDESIYIYIYTPSMCVSRIHVRSCYQKNPSARASTTYKPLPSKSPEIS